MLLLLNVWLLGGLIGYLAAERRHFSKGIGVVAGLVLGPVFAFVLFWVSGVVHANDFRGGRPGRPAPAPRPRRNPLTVALVATNVVLGLIAFGLLLVR